MGDGLQRVLKAARGLCAEDASVRKVWNMCQICDGQRAMTLNKKTAQYVIDLPSHCERKADCEKNMKPGA